MHVGKKELLSRVDLIATFTSNKYNKIPISGARGLLRLLCFEPDQSVPLHRHPKADEYFFVIREKAKLPWEAKKPMRNQALSSKLRAGLLHQWKNGSERLVLLSVLIPTSSYKFPDEAVKMEVI